MSALTRSWSPDSLVVPGPARHRQTPKDADVFPFDRSRRLAGNVLNHPRHTDDVVDDAGGCPLREFVGEISTDSPWSASAAQLPGVFIPGLPT